MFLFNLKMNQTEKDLVTELKRRIFNLSASPFKKQRNILRTNSYRINQLHPIPQ